jgi:hypothetical protein
MGTVSTRSSGRRDRWVARLVRVQLAVSGLASRAESRAREDRWPARLMQVGAALVGLGGVLVVTWVRRRL